MTPFRFEHVFRAPSPTALLEAYFDVDHEREQDAAVAIDSRELVERVDSPELVRRVSIVTPRRQLSPLVKPFLSGPLCFRETVIWRRADDHMTIEIRPSLLRGRATSTGIYQLAQLGRGEVLRTYSGEVSVDIALVSTRVERGIIAEFARSMPPATACTQAWLDRRALPVSVTPRSDLEIRS